MQTATIVFKTDGKEFRIPSGAIVSSTSSPGASTMRPPPPPPPKTKGHDSKLEEPSSSIPDLGEFYSRFITRLFLRLEIDFKFRYLSTLLLVFISIIIMILNKFIKDAKKYPP